MHDTHFPSSTAVIHAIIARVPTSLHGRNEQIAAARDGDAECGVTNAVEHVEIIAPDTAAQLAKPHFLPRRHRRKARADQIDVGHAINLVVIGDAAIAIAEAALGPHVELGARADLTCNHLVAYYLCHG